MQKFRIDGGFRLKSAVFSLRPAPPFRLDLTVWALRRRPDNQVDFWDGETYRRALMLGGKLAGKVVEVAVAQTGLPDAPRIEARVSGARLTSGVTSAVTEALDRLLGLKIDLSRFYRLAADDRRLGPLAERFRGIKPPRFPTVFEAVVNGIACQQFTLTVGIRMLNRLAENYGATIAASAESPLHAFPQPSDLAGLKPERLKRLKFSRQKIRALIELSNTVVEGKLNLEELASLDDETAVERLLQLWGVGRWTAEYALLRGLGRLDVFPGDDVGARNNLQRWLRLKKPLDYESVRRTLKRWEPYAGLIYFHLLLDSLAEAGMISPEQYHST
ncbi:MAG: DNA-3-methyladenine glycosylase [Blastocatellales bacterium]